MQTGTFSDSRGHPDVFTAMENVTTRADGKDRIKEKRQIRVSLDEILSLEETRGEKQTCTLMESCMNNVEREWGGGGGGLSCALTGPSLSHNKCKLLH